MIRPLDTTPVRVQLELANTPANVTVVRSLVSALAEAIELDGALSDRLRTAVSEAANNIVLHAYDDGGGTMSITIAAVAETIDVRVTDHGRGIRPALPSHDRMGLGLAVISAMSDRAEFISGPGEGAEVHLVFQRRIDGHAPAPEAVASGVRQISAPKLDGDIVVSLEPSAALGHILGRISHAVAAQRRFRSVRIADLDEITHALTVAAETNPDPHAIGFSISAEERRLDLTLGPLRLGAGRSTETARTDAGVPIGELVDELATEPAGDDSEFVTLRVTDAGEAGRD